MKRNEIQWEGKRGERNKTNQVENEGKFVEEGKGEGKNY